LITNTSAVTEELVYGTIIRSYKNNIIWCISKYNLNKRINTNEITSYSFSEEVLKAIKEHSAIAIVDASVKRNFMGAV